MFGSNVREDDGFERMNLKRERKKKMNKRIEYRSLGKIN